VILVTSAFGTQKRLLLPKLADAGIAVRALRERPREDELRALGATEVVIGDAADPATLLRRLPGEPSSSTQLETVPSGA
jgi:uncharacterized protein YbjT (DUF2867 family)